MIPIASAAVAPRKPAVTERPAPKTPPRAAPAAMHRDTFEPARPRSAPNRGAAAARASVQLDTASTRAQQAQVQLGQAQKQTQRLVEQTFASAKSGRLPPGYAAVKSADPNRAEIVQRARNGEVLSRTLASRGGNQVSFQRLSYGSDGVANQTLAVAGPSGVTSTQASWNERRSERPAAPPTVAALESGQAPSLQLTQNSITRSGAALSTHSLVQGPSGVTDTTTSFGRQTGTSGIHGSLAGEFHAGVIDTARTETIHLPVPCSLGPDGKLATASATDSVAYSQGNVQATSTAVSQAASEQVRVPTAEDVDLFRISREDDEGGNFHTSPKQWTLEKSNGTDAYSAQTFVEGTDLSTVTHRAVSGNTVTESTTGSAPNAHGDPVPVSSTVTESFAADGGVSRYASNVLDTRGVRTLEDYERTQRLTPKGLDVTEQTHAQQIDPGGASQSLDRVTNSRISRRGIQLVSVDEKVRDARGQSFEQRSDGKPVELKSTPPSMSGLASQTFADINDEVEGFASDGVANAAVALDGGNPSAVSEGAEAVGGLAELAGGVNSLVAGIRNDSFPQIAIALGHGALGGYHAYSSGRELIDSLRGVAAESPAASAVGTALTVSNWLDKVPGVSADAATSAGIFASRIAGPLGALAGGAAGGIQLVQGIESGNDTTIAQGGVGLAGAVGSAAAIGLIGGPEGAAVGAVVGLASFGVQELIGLFSGPDHHIAPVKI